MGVHDHGFNNVSTWGALRRLALEGRYEPEGRERDLCELALKASGAVQARRWTRTADGGGFVFSFNGPHSLFADTMRSLRSLALAHRLGHALLEEGDRPVSLLERLVPPRPHHLALRASTRAGGATSGTSGAGWRTRASSTWWTAATAAPGRSRATRPSRRGRAGRPGCSSASRRSWSSSRPFRTPSSSRSGGGPRSRATCSRRRARSPPTTCSRPPRTASPTGTPGPPGLARMPGHRDRPADPANDHEPVDASAAPIAAQGLLRLGRLARAARGGGGRAAPLPGGPDDHPHAPRAALPQRGPERTRACCCTPSTTGRTAGTTCRPARKVPCGESSQWGDYHLRELALHVQRLADGAPYYTFFAPVEPRGEAGRPRHGGTRGIGLGIARALARDGFDLALCGVREEKDVAPVLAELRSGGAAHYFRADIGERADRVRLVSEVPRSILPAARPRQQRRHGTPGARGPPRGGRGQLRAAAARQPAGSLLPHPGRREVDARAEAGGRTLDRAAS